MTVVRRWVATAVVVPLLAAGCSDDPEPKFEPSPSPSESASEPAEPAEPKAWEVKSEKGAYAFVRHWVSTLNEAGRTGLTDDLAAMSSKPCETCQNIIGYIDEVYGEGGRVDSNGWRIVNLGELPEGVTGNRATVPTRIHESRQVVFRKGPNKRVTVKPSNFTMSFEIEWSQGWSVTDAVIVT